MAYGLNPALFLENGPANRAAETRARRSTLRTWRSLDDDRRLALVDGALKFASNDNCCDGFPIAL